MEYLKLYYWDDVLIETQRNYIEFALGVNLTINQNK